MSDKRTWRLEEFELEELMRGIEKLINANDAPPLIIVGILEGIKTKILFNAIGDKK